MHLYIEKASPQGVLLTASTPQLWEPGVWRSCLIEGPSKGNQVIKSGLTVFSLKFLQDWGAAWNVWVTNPKAQLGWCLRQGCHRLCMVTGGLYQYCTRPLSAPHCGLIHPTLILAA